MSAKRADALEVGDQLVVSAETTVPITAVKVGVAATHDGPGNFVDVTVDIPNQPAFTFATLRGDIWEVQA